MGAVLWAVRYLLLLVARGHLPAFIKRLVCFAFSLSSDKLINRLSICPPLLPPTNLLISMKLSGEESCSSVHPSSPLPLFREKLLALSTSSVLAGFRFPVHGSRATNRLRQTRIPPFLLCLLPLHS
ncbi:hypothetical protein GGR50DRAFT_550445 [Xylaria sp. CBS 124048]|nr:hypothetical protein GGR50DRAFT_550445 [Xylaria sp. CBS 124048]